MVSAVSCPAHSLEYDSYSRHATSGLAPTVGAQLETPQLGNLLRLLEYSLTRTTLIFVYWHNPPFAVLEREFVRENNAQVHQEGVQTLIDVGGKPIVVLPSLHSLVAVTLYGRRGGRSVLDK